MHYAILREQLAHYLVKAKVTIYSLNFFKVFLYWYNFKILYRNIQSD